MGDEDVPTKPLPQNIGLDPSFSRPPKRRRTAHRKDVIPAAPELNEPEYGNGDVLMDETEETLPAPEQRGPTPSLPIFPLPTLPNAPSKSTLALQGLDKALIDAEVIDPDVVMPILAEGPDDGGSRLSEKMRKRLSEAGINELFAGVFFSSYCYVIS
jgi:ATP-dependent RNA helicase DDX51/DBP6